MKNKASAKIKENNVESGIENVESISNEKEIIWRQRYLLRGRTPNRLASRHCRSRVATALIATRQLFAPVRALTACCGVTARLLRCDACSCILPYILCRAIAYAIRGIPRSTKNAYSLLAHARNTHCTGMPAFVHHSYARVPHGIQTLARTLDDKASAVVAHMCAQPPCWRATAVTPGIRHRKPDKLTPRMRVVAR